MSTVQPLFPGESGVDQLVEIIKVTVTTVTLDIRNDFFASGACTAGIW